MHRRWLVLGVGCGVLWSSAASAAESGFIGPRNILHADVLALSAGERIAGVYWEHVRREDTDYWSFLTGVGVAWDFTLEPIGELDVTELDLDELAIGLQWRYYGERPSGMYGILNTSLVLAEGSGVGDDGRHRDYRFAGIGLFPLSLGYRVLLAPAVIDLAVSFTLPATGYFFQRNGGDDGIGAIGGYGFVLAGGIGFGF